MQNYPEISNCSFTMFMSLDHTLAVNHELFACY